MKVEIFNLCDFAAADSVGKLTMVGVFDVLWAREAPITHGLCALAVRIRFGKIEEGIKNIKISLTDSDGRLMMPAMELQAPVRIDPDSPTAIGQVVSIISQLRLPNFGEYAVDLAIDGRQEASTPLFVKQLPAPQQPQIQS